MKANTNTILYSADELRIRVRRWCRQSAPARLATHRKDVPEPELQSAAVTPGANGVCELHGLGAAFHSEPDEGVWHEALAKSRVNGSEH